MFDPKNPAAGSTPPERLIRITPLDMRQHHFKTVMRGFDRTEVVAFLTEAADDYEQALREIDRLRSDLMRMEALLDGAPRTRGEPSQYAAHGAEAVRRHQGRRSARSADHDPRSGGARGPRHPEGAVEARGNRARHQRAPPSAPIGGRLARGLDPGPLSRARVHTRSGQGRTGEGAAAPATAGGAAAAADAAGGHLRRVEGRGRTITSSFVLRA